MSELTEPNIMSIQLLDDDCLDYIFDFLPDLCTDIQTARTCTRFRELIKRKWCRYRPFDTLDLEWLRDLLPEQVDLIYFLKEMRCHFVRMVINYDCLAACLKDLKHMQITELPRIIGFSYDSDEIDCYPTDEDMLNLTKLLPNLQKLHFIHPISGRFIVNFQQLNELLLYDDQHKDFEIEQIHLDAICHNLKQLRVLDIRTYDNISELRLDNCVAHLNCLTTLKLNLATLKPVLNSVLKLPKLRKLLVLLDYEFNVANIVNVDTHDYKIYETQEFFTILEVKGASISSIAVDAYYMPLKIGWDNNLSIHQFKKLEQLIICSWLETPDSLLRYIEMSNLRLLCCRNWTLLTDKIVLEFVKHCTQLQNLDVSYCKTLTEQVPLKSLALLKEQQQRRERQTPLIVHYLLSGFEDNVDVARDWWRQQSAHICLTKDFPENGERGLSYVERGYEFEFSVLE